LQPIELGSRGLGFAAQALNLTGRLRCFSTQQFNGVLEVGDPLQCGVAFGSKGANTSFERVDMIDDLFAMEATHHDLERWR
jgi:hypothetical protein